MTLFSLAGSMDICVLWIYVFYVHMYGHMYSDICPLWTYVFYEHTCPMDMCSMNICVLWTYVFYGHMYSMDICVL